MSLLPVRFSRKLMFVPFVTKSQLKPKGKADEKCFYKIVCFVAGENSLIWERCKENKLASLEATLVRNYDLLTH